jgi:hypothetical protein
LCFVSLLFSFPICFPENKTRCKRPRGSQEHSFVPPNIQVFTPPPWLRSWDLSVFWQSSQAAAGGQHQARAKQG